MLRRGRWAPACAALAVAALLGSLGLAGAAEKVGLVRAAIGGRNGDLELLTGGLLLREGEPGGAFGTVRLAKGKRRFTYFVVLKHALSSETGGQASETARVNSTGVSESKQLIRVGDNKVTVVYRVTIDARKRALKKETLTVNGKEVPLAKGRVLLVDLTGEQPTWSQKDLDLPGQVGEVGTGEAAEALVKETLADLAKQDKAVREFLAPPKP